MTGKDDGAAAARVVLTPAVDSVGNRTKKKTKSDEMPTKIKEEVEEPPGTSSSSSIAGPTQQNGSFVVLNKQMMKHLAAAAEHYTTNAQAVQEILRIHGN